MRHPSTCGCCSGVGAATPRGIENRPGLSEIAYRPGTYPEFFASMIAGLSRSDRKALSTLTTRERDDFTIALLDSWAMVADVLTFYDERLANESFLRTAQGRSSIQELGKLIGYQLAPGAAAEAHLAFSVEHPPEVPESLPKDPGSAPILPPPEVAIEPGLRVQSVPGPGEDPQTFETVEAIVARPEWNAIPASTTHTKVPMAGDTEAWLAGVGLNLKRGDPFLFVSNGGTGGGWDLRFIQTISEDPDHERTHVTWSDPLGDLTGASEVLLMLKRLSVFGHNAPSPDLLDIDTDDWEFRLTPEDSHGVDLDGSHPDVVERSWVVLRADENIDLWRVSTVVELSRADYAISGRVTRLTLSSGSAFSTFEKKVRETTVYAVNDPLTLADAPDDTEVSGYVEVDLDISDMEPGRNVIVAGTDTNGNDRSELVTVESVSSHGGRWRLTFESDLEHSYERESVVVYGNVALATHGETVSEILGSGKASQPFQTFRLSQTPLTYVQSSGSSGVSSTLEVRVNGVRWKERPTLFEADSEEHLYTVRLDPDGQRVVRFGDGVKGSRLPTGSQNIRASYRKGVGKDGNVLPGALAQLLDRPLGLKGVTNPAAAGGGVDPESEDEAKDNMPFRVRTLGRAVSLLDYEDYARDFAGVAKAHAAVLSLAGGRTILVTVAFAPGVVTEPAPRIAALTSSLRKFGDPQIQVQLANHEQQRFRLSLKATIDPDHDAATVVEGIRTTLLDSFSFDRRDFVQPVHLSEIVATAHQVPGLLAADISDFYVTGSSPPSGDRLLAQPPSVDALGAALPAGLLTIDDPDPFDTLETTS